MPQWQVVYCRLRRHFDIGARKQWPKRRKRRRKKSQVADVWELNRATEFNMKNPELYAIISVFGGVVHLDHSVNPDAASCQGTKDGLQLESYLSLGWKEPVTNPRLENDFWGVWSDWNGKVTGGILLNDYFSVGAWKAMRCGLKVVSPKDIKNLSDGRYVVYAEVCNG